MSRCESHESPFTVFYHCFPSNTVTLVGQRGITLASSHGTVNPVVQTPHQLISVGQVRFPVLDHNRRCQYMQSMKYCGIFFRLQLIIRSRVVRLKRNAIN